MYTFLIGDDNTITTTCRENIMRYSKLVDKMQFLVPQFYKEYDMSKFTVVLEYILPISRRYCTEILELSEDMYADHLVYRLPFDTNLTNECGDIELQLTFACAELDADGNSIQLVRKTSTNKITILPIATWSDIIPDSALSALDQRIIKLDADAKALEAYVEALESAKADNLAYDKETGVLQLMSGKNEVGDHVIIKSCECGNEVNVVDLNNEKAI